MGQSVGSMYCELLLMIQAINFIKDRLQIPLLILSEFKWINFFSLLNSSNLMISMGTERNKFVWILLILEAKWGDNLLPKNNFAIFLSHISNMLIVFYLSSSSFIWERIIAFNFNGCWAV